jgi:hypothetical protein
MTESGTSYIAIAEKLRSRTSEQLKLVETVGLSFAPDKSEPIHYAAKRTRHNLTLKETFPTLIINDTDQTEIRPSKQIKQLGAVIDNTISFKPHAIQAASAVRCRLGALCFLRSGKIGILAHIANHLALTAVFQNFSGHRQFGGIIPMQFLILLQKHIIV